MPLSPLELVTGTCTSALVGRDRCDDSAVRDGVSRRPWIVDNDLLIEPPLPPWPQKSPGPRPVADWLCLQDILYVLHNDIAWKLLPLELGFGPDRPAGGVWTAGSRPGVFD